MRRSMFLPAMASTLTHTCLLLLLQVAVSSQQLDSSAQTEQNEQIGGPSLAPSASHQRQHEDIQVRPQEPVRIPCKLPSMAESKTRYYHWNFQQTSGGSSKPHVLCYDQKCPLETDFGFRLDLDRSSGAYDLVIDRVSYELNDGTYYCDYKDTSPESKMIINREYKLTVLMPPGPPSLQPAAGQAPAREGQEHQLQCQTQGGNPEPQVSWFRNEQPLLAAGASNGNGQWPQQAQSPTRIETQTNRMSNTTTSLLTFTPTIEDHLAQYRCQVRNQAMEVGRVMERELRLQVEYAPRIQVGAHNPLKVLEGQQVTLVCQVEANPPVKGVRWLRDGSLVSNQYNYTLASVKLADAGLYTCQADNGIVGQSAAAVGFFAQLFHGAESTAAAKPAEAQLQLLVLHPPRVQVRPSKPLPLNEGDLFALNCSVQAQPEPYEYVWTKSDDSSFRRQQASPLLEFTNVAAADTGNYTCTAHNRLEPSQQAPQERQASGWHPLQVRHKPGQAELVIGQNGETELAAKTMFLCRAKPPGFPEPTYRFWKWVGTEKKMMKQTSGNSYTLIAAKPDDEARYGCSAANQDGASSEAEAELVVNEPPTIISDNSARRDEDSRLPGESSYSITVRGSGKPEPKVSWFHRSPVDGRRYELSSAPSKFRIETSKVEVPHHHHHHHSHHGNHQQSRSKFHVTTTLNFRQPLQVGDRGQYTVELSNGLSRVAREQFQLHISHPPQPVAKNQPLVPVASTSSQQQPGAAPTYRAKAGAELGEQVNLSCRVSAYPKPEINWYGPGTADSERAIDTSSRYKIELSNPRDDIWESTLSFVLSQDSDYNDYMCVYANQDQQTQRLSDSARTVISLGHKTVPDAPSQLEAADVGQDYVSLQWTGGYDGGFTQNQYIVQWAPDDGLGLPSLARRFANADASNSLELAAAADFPRLQDCLSSNPCTIQGLSPRQPYVFRLRAKNELGFSEFSEELTLTTRANSSQIPKILEPTFDAYQNILHFRIDPNSDYPLTNLNARIEVKAPPPQQQQQQQQKPQEPLEYAVQELAVPQNTIVNLPIRQDQVEAHLDVAPGSDEIRLVLCSRSNESLCGPETSLNLRAAPSSLFGSHQRGLSLYMLISTVTLIVLVGAMATTLHSCCLVRAKNKKAEAIEHANGNLDNKASLEGANGHHHHHQRKNGSHGSTASTNSTLANGVQSLDSVNGVAHQLAGGLMNGNSSDHSSDHSRQAKLDSMLPPNYNHYADRLMMEQQQQAQMQQQQQQQGLVADKLGSPFVLANNALLGVAQQQQHFGYADQQQHSSLEHHMMSEPNQMMLAPSDAESQQQQQQQQQMWASAEDYNNYNALAGYQQDQMIDPTYGTTGASLMMAPQAATYDNNYLNSYQQQQYQQLAAAQQQMYGTLTRNGYAASAAGTEMDQSPSVAQQQQLIEQQQQYSTGTNGLVASQTQQQQQQQQQESDYGTTGGSRGGRVIREIIV